MSALLLVPYNDSMRLGQGYNSFLQVPCLGNAVEITDNDGEATLKTTGATSQVRNLEWILEIASNRLGCSDSGVLVGLCFENFGGCPCNEYLCWKLNHDWFGLRVERCCERR